MIPVVFIGQSYNYIQYTTRDGLGGSTVYDMCQDMDGFIWFATNNGLTRFDGKNFKNFTVKDGLPDNEVLKIFPDSMGRVWIASFKNEISYLGKGKIFNKQNSKFLDYNTAYGRILDIAQMRAGTVWFFTSKYLLSYNYGESIRVQLEKELNPGRVYSQLGTGPAWFGDKLPVVANDSIFYFTDSGLVFYRKYFNFSGQKEGYGISIVLQDTLKFKLDDDITTISTRNHRPYFAATIGGAVELDTLTLKSGTKFLPGKVVTRAIIDKEGGYWFSTLGDGVFKLVNKEVLTYAPFKESTSWNEVFSIASSQKNIVTGNFKSTIIEWDKNNEFRSYSFASYLPIASNKLATNRLNSIFSLADGKFLLGFDAFLIRWDGRVNNVQPISAIKSIAFDDDEHVILATGLCVVRVSVKSLAITDTIWPSRATSAVRLGDKYFIGTLNGLVEVNAITKKSRDITIHPSLVRRITDLKVNNHALWVATSDSGVVQIKGEKILRTFSEANGLNSNTCRVLYPYQHSLWIGTNKGICKLDLLNPQSFPVKFDSYNLLPSDIINAIHIKDNVVYVGSPSGVTFFKEEDLINFSICKLFIESIRTEKGIFPDMDSFDLAIKPNRFEVDFSTISIKSAGEISYYFRMKGLENDWRNTKSELITYSSIPSGSYQFEIYAVNKFGVVSDTKKIFISVPFPFWKQPIFWVIIILAFIGLSVFVFKLREKQLRDKLEAKNQTEKQLAALEQKALQAQMNPHFIFNSLNSIQQFVLKNNVEDANRYLGIFATLIRETLENSSSGKISLQREISYLSRYLELERMRLGNMFEFVISSNGLEEDENMKIPVMLFQPFVENAVRHGMRYINDGGGLIRIDFWRDTNNVICRIRDNGPGREESRRIKSKQHIEYQSRGMDLTQRRVDILNMIFEEKVTIDVNDVRNDLGLVAGTEVMITITQVNNEDNN